MIFMSHDSYFVAQSYLYCISFLGSLSMGSSHNINATKGTEKQILMVLKNYLMP